MNPNDRNTPSNDPNSNRREQETQGNDPRRSAPGSDQTWNQPSQNPKGRPGGQTDGADDDEDVDDGETRQAGSLNPGTRRETPDDAMRRERGEPGPEQGDRTQRSQSERDPDDRSGQ